MKNRMLLHCFPLAAVLSAALFAATPAAAQTIRLTLPEAVALGLENSATVAARRTALAAAQEDVKAARAAYYPSVSGGVSWAHLFEQPQSPGLVLPAGSLGGGVPSDEVALSPAGYLAARDPLGLSVDVSQTITTFGKTSGAIRLAEEAVTQAGLALEEERRKLAIQIERAFYSYLLAKEVLAINEETFAGKEDALAVVRTRFQAGVVSDFEVLRVEADLESFRANVISAANGVRVALLNLRNAIGIDEEAHLELVGELVPTPVELDRDRLIARALAARYELTAFRKTMDILRAQERLNRSLRRPTLVAWANYRLQSGFDRATGDNRYFESGAWDGTLTAGVNLVVPVSAHLPWSKEAATLRKSGLQLQELELQYRDLTRGIRLAVESSVLRIAEEEAKIASGRKSVALAQRLYDSAVIQYEGGYIASTELRDVQISLNAAKLGYTQAIFGYNQNVLALMDAVGVAGF